MMFEVEGVSEDLAREAMDLAAQKLPIPTKFISRHSGALI
jgi:large subunit ribosomal protein L16